MLQYYPTLQYVTISPFLNIQNKVTIVYQFTLQYLTVLVYPTVETIVTLLGLSLGV